LSTPLVFLIFIFSFSPFFSSAAELPGVIFNEIAWMGSPALENAANKEWIELYNNSLENISLDGWKIIAADGSPQISLKGIIPSYGFFLLERVNDYTLTNVIADQIYTGALENSGESLMLFDKDNNLKDEILANNGWPAGDNKTKQTMEKTVSGWANSLNPGGTPKTKNSSGSKLKISPSPLTPKPSSSKSVLPSTSPSLTQSNTEIPIRAGVSLNKEIESEQRPLPVKTVVFLALSTMILLTTAFAVLKFAWYNSKM